MVRCSIIGCKSNSERKISRLSFHSFPGDSELRSLWIAATKRTNWIPRPSSKICSEHFDNKLLWKTGSRTYLNPDAVPNMMKIKCEPCDDDFNDGLSSQPSTSHHHDYAVFSTSVQENIPTISHTSHIEDQDCLTSAEYSIKTIREMESLPEPPSQSDTHATINTYYGKCKCCLESGYMKSMWSEYYWEGIREIYGEMLMETFSLTWDLADDNEFICDSCVLRLREAYNFKKDVLASFKVMCNDSEEFEKSSLPVKVEDADFNIDYEIKEEQADDDMMSGTEKEYYEVEYLKEHGDSLNKEGTANTIVVKDTTPKVHKSPKKKKNEDIQKPYNNYPEEDMRNCLEMIQQNAMSVTDASKFLGLPRKTVTAKLRSLRAKNSG